MATTPAVIFVSYRLPERRLREHFLWNDFFYRQSCIVFAVLEHTVEGLPWYVHQVIFPAERLPKIDGKTVFSPAATRNAGLAAALETQCDPIITTDVDIAFDPKSWAKVSDPPLGTVIIPVYCMLAYRGRKHSSDHYDYGATGVVSARRSVWRDVRYDERCIAYGGEDGIIRAEMARRGIIDDRGVSVDHIAHVEGVNPQRVPGHGNSNCWNADSFNPDNYAANKLYYP